MQDKSDRLFDPWTLRGITFRNRTVVSPMCQYSAEGGIANDYHLVHLGRFALGGFGLVMVEATAISPEGRLTYGDLGLWDDSQLPPLRRVVDFAHGHGARIGLQLGHAGAKAATLPPWVSEGERPEDSRWDIYSATDEPHSEGWQRPSALTTAELEHQLDGWKAAVKRAVEAGFDVIEIHAAHGYLLHSFLSPLSNTRTDEFGGSLEGRMRYPLRVVEAVREVWPDERPLFVRLSVIDGAPGGISLEDSIEFARRLKEVGVDLVDCSSGGIGSYHHEIRPGYQVHLAAELRRRVEIPTLAVGLIADAWQADDVIRTAAADLVALGREALVNPSWPVAAREQLGQFADGDRFDLLPVQSKSWIGKRRRQLDRVGAAVPGTVSGESLKSAESGRM
ncbi:2,4-dienoyl-CoA reductase-like NADH-dependent reductase (Old Yellow Enzyme family) [Rhodococcus sp. SMB37]|uniref:NADH:flavin oxidoreductase/NADH oxidase n=1 Tax=Rhodococcus sp. SMB37 TaxID=2512213 RepID=UPI001051EDC0|nr:NADH:flavin oxidoreductase/NADH oxidase [Rhodococcus sp. SMB37]TCN53438.1 2,4-dienoyl-CoA reductase-like NADH-dependent reductase (Old Yellow Enzyme family) [Rhodococcus sp. SMB37]